MTPSTTTTAISDRRTAALFPGTTAARATPARPAPATFRGAPVRTDPLLVPFLQATRSVEAERHLDRLVREVAEPVIKNVVWSRYRVLVGQPQGRYEAPQEQEALEAYGEAITQLLARLRAGKDDPGSQQPISDVRAYAAVTAFRACHHSLRDKYPQRFELRSRIRSVLTHRPEFALWKGNRGETLCGLTGWQHERCEDPAGGARIALVRNDPHAAAEAALPPQDYQRKRPHTVLSALFGWLGRPITLDDLVRFLAELWNVRDAPPVQGQDADEGLATAAYERAPDPTVDVAAQAERRAYLARVWDEICLLPPKQRSALLLNLRDGQGRGVLVLFPLTGVAMARQIAEMLGLTTDELGALWDELPLEDAVIAARLQVTPRQVISLRRVARLRLERRTKGYEQQT